jgi:hypothetical protein
MAHPDASAAQTGDTLTIDWNAVDDAVHRMESLRQTLVVQHTIAMKARLLRTQVSDGVRAFLLDVWVEVMAEAESRLGAQAEATLKHRATGDELIRIAATRREHDRLHLRGHRLPHLVPALQEGMALLGLDPTEQAALLQEIEHGMAEPLPSTQGSDPTDGWSAAVLLLSRREPFVDSFRLKSHRELNDASLRTMTFADHLHLQVVSRGGMVPDAQRLQQMRELQRGARYWRKPNPRARVAVQLEWMGADGQLVLMCDEFHTGYLYHPMRVAHHLQAGLLVPQTPA